MEDKDAKNNNKNKNKAESSSLPFEMGERAKRSSPSSTLRPEQEGAGEELFYLTRKGLKQLSALKNLMQC